MFKKKKIEQEAFCILCGEEGDADYIKQHLNKHMERFNEMMGYVPEKEEKMSRDELTDKVSKDEIDDRVTCGICGEEGQPDYIKWHMESKHPGEHVITWTISEGECKVPEELVIAERLSIPQEESNRILCIGHKVRYEGQPYVISDIRVWHDLDLELPGEKRFHILCDLASISTGRRVIVNAEFKELKMWKPFSYVGTRPKIEL